MLRPRECWGLGAFSVSVLGAVMLLGIWRSPEVFDMRIEVIHFPLCAGALSAIAMLAGQLSQIRHRLQVQTLELRGALDRGDARRADRAAEPAACDGVAVP
jgi:hypothetical protein